MGAGVSSALGPEGEGGAHETGMGDLPESCVAAVMLNLEPMEICRLARLSRTFRGAATADFVWEAKLPKNYGYLIEKASDEKNSMGYLTKKDIYARLCRPNPFDGGTKEFWMEKSRGRICMSISSKALSITGIDDRRYWNHIPTEESRWDRIGSTSLFYGINNLSRYVTSLGSVYLPLITWECVAANAEKSREGMIYVGTDVTTI